MTFVSSLNKSFEFSHLLTDFCPSYYNRGKCFLVDHIGVIFLPWRITLFIALILWVLRRKSEFIQRRKMDSCQEESIRAHLDSFYSTSLWGRQGVSPEVLHIFQQNSRCPPKVFLIDTTFHTTSWKYHIPLWGKPDVFKVPFDVQWGSMSHCYTF